MDKQYLTATLNDILKVELNRFVKALMHIGVSVFVFIIGLLLLPLCILGDILTICTKNSKNSDEM